MLVTRKNYVFSFFSGKPAARSTVIANSVTKAQNLNDTKFDQLDKRITITKSEDLYKAHDMSLFNPVNRLNR